MDCKHKVQSPSGLCTGSQTLSGGQISAGQPASPFSAAHTATMDLAALYKAVGLAGGAERVKQKKLWRPIGCLFFNK